MRVDSIAEEQEKVRTGKWFQSPYSVFVAIISLLRSLFPKSEAPQQLPFSQPPTPLISNSKAMKTLPSFSEGNLPSSPSHSALFMDAKHSSPTKLGHKQQSVHKPITESPSSVLESIDNTPALESSKFQRMNPNIVKLFRDQELGKTLLNYVIPISVAILTVYPKHSSSLPVPLIVVSLCIGLTALWNGILLRNTLPDAVANAMEQFGAASIFFAFFSVVSSLLPPQLVWVPWTCYVVILLPSVLSCIRVDSIAEEQEKVRTGEWFQSPYSVFVTKISLLQSLFPKSEPPQELPFSQPPTPLISNSKAMKTLPSSSEDNLPSSPTHSALFMDTKHSSPTKLGHKQQCVHMPITESPSSVLENIDNTPTLESSKFQRMNPNIVKLFRDQELGKTLLNYVIPISVAILTVYPEHSSSLPVPLIVVSLCIGLTALWNGILLRNTLPDAVANAMEQFGAASIFFAFFSVVGLLLPPQLVWVPWTCFVVILLPSVLSCTPVRDTGWIH